MGAVATTIDCRAEGGAVHRRGSVWLVRGAVKVSLGRRGVMVVDVASGWDQVGTTARAQRKKGIGREDSHGERRFGLGRL